MTKLPFRLLAALVVCSAPGSPARAQYTQNFNTLANTGTSASVPAGWVFNEVGADANATYTASTGSGNAGDTYSFGAAAAADRAFGGLRSGNVIPTLGVRLQNETANSFTRLDITYTGEQWRLGASGRADLLIFQCSLFATSITDANAIWVDVPALYFYSPITAGTVGALDGNLAANRTQLTGSITVFPFGPGDAIWFRWLDLDATGEDDGLGIDDFTVTQSLTPAPVPEPGSILALAAGALGLGGYARRRARQPLAV